MTAGVIDDGGRIACARGTPQGTVISPMSSHIFLHSALGLWAHQWRQRNAAIDVIIVLYADDGELGFQYEGDARRFLTALLDRLAKFKLEFHPNKTRLI